MTEKPLLTRQLDVLGDWLAKSSWSDREAACILIGVLPPDRMGDASDFGGWLPGREPWEVGREAWNQITLANIAHLKSLFESDKRVIDHTPESYLALAARLRIVPPWSKAILGSRCHSIAVSAKVRAALREALGEVQETNPAANRSFGALAENWDEAVFRAVELRNHGKTPKEIADALAAEGFYRDRKNTKLFGTPAIRRWFREMKSDSENRILRESALEYTEAFRNWRDRVKR